MQPHMKKVVFLSLFLVGFQAQSAGLCADLFYRVSATSRLTDAEMEKVFPKSIERRLQMYAPKVYKEISQSKNVEWIEAYHGADSHPTQVNPVMVNRKGDYFLAYGEDARGLSLAYMSGRGERRDYYPLGQGASRYKRLLNESKYFGFIFKYKIPEIAIMFPGAYVVKNSIVINDFLFTETIGVYNLVKMKKEAEKPKGERGEFYEEAIEWYTPQEFFVKFFNGDIKQIQEMISLKRSKNQID